MDRNERRLWYLAARLAAHSACYSRWPARIRGQGQLATDWLAGRLIISIRTFTIIVRYQMGSLIRARVSCTSELQAICSPIWPLDRPLGSKGFGPEGMNIESEPRLPVWPN